MKNSVTINCSILAWSLWTLAAICVWIEMELPATEAVMIAAMIFVGGAATLHVRSFIAEMGEQSERRELNAFELGRDSVRSIR